MDLLRRIFTSDEFLPRGHCYLWNPGLVWLHLVSDLLIGCACVAISLLAYAVVRRIRIPFGAIIVAFAVFLGATGLAHFLEAVTLWEPIYWVSGVLKAVTAAASVATGIFLVPVRPKVVEVARAAQLCDERRLELEDKSSELETLYSKVKEVDEVKTQLLAKVSQELRTPLSLILGPVERVLGEAQLPPQDRRDLEVAARNGRHLLRLVNDLLDVARPEAGRVEPSYTEADLAQIVRAMAGHFDALARERHVDLQITAPDAIPAQLDVEKTERIVFNLLSNALKFAPSGGTVRCTADARGTVTVEDSGPGGAPADREILGLSIAREFARCQGGSVNAGNSALGGARFELRLPLRAPAGAPLARRSETPPPVLRAQDQLLSEVEEVAPEPGKPLALLVEDDADTRELLRRSLGPEVGVAAARDGHEALAKALSLRPDVIVTDLMLPEHSGEDLLRDLRAHPEVAAPVLFVTARTEPDVRARLLRAGAHDILGKPFAPAELKARVGNLVAMKRTRELLQQELASHASDLEQLARQLVSRIHELQAALASARAARQHAEKATHAKSIFLGLVSHELRTGVATLKLDVRALEREVSGELVGRLQRSIQRLGDLIESAQELARLESGRLLTDVRAFDLPALAAELVDELRPHAQQKLLELRLRETASMPPLHSDPRLVRLVLLSLVLNAVKYTERGQVEVSLDYRNGRHRFTVSDTGPGVPAEAQARIFEPPQAGQAVLEKQPGVGLGLSLVREIVAALGGAVELRSAPGSGSTFTVSLPPGDAGARSAAG